MIKESKKKQAKNKSFEWAGKNPERGHVKKLLIGCMVAIVLLALFKISYYSETSHEVDSSWLLSEGLEIGLIAFYIIIVLLLLIIFLVIWFFIIEKNRAEQVVLADSKKSKE